ncbi:MAG: nucleoside-diphosphate kinase [Nitrospinota bacterium]
MERTLAIVKPDAVSRGLVGEVLGRIEEAGFRIRALKMKHLTREEAEAFYAVHRERPFYRSLTAFMASGPSVLMVLEKEGAIAQWRDLMGATDPAEAAAGTLRALYGENIERNAVHGSDEAETAAFEVPFFFSDAELAP